MAMATRIVGAVREAGIRTRMGKVVARVALRGTIGMGVVTPAAGAVLVANTRTRHTKARARAALELSPAAQRDAR